MKNVPGMCCFTSTSLPKLQSIHKKSSFFFFFQFLAQIIEPCKNLRPLVFHERWKGSLPLAIWTLRGPLPPRYYSYVAPTQPRQGSVTEHEYHILAWIWPTRQTAYLNGWLSWTRLLDDTFTSTWLYTNRKYGPETVKTGIQQDHILTVVNQVYGAKHRKLRRKPELPVISAVRCN